MYCNLNVKLQCLVTQCSQWKGLLINDPNLLVSVLSLIVGKVVESCLCCLSVFVFVFVLVLYLWVFLCWVESAYCICCDSNLLCRVLLLLQPGTLRDDQLMAAFVDHTGAHWERDRRDLYPSLSYIKHVLALAHTHYTELMGLVSVYAILNMKWKMKTFVTWLWTTLPWHW